YSTIANIHQSHKQQLIDSHIPSTIEYSEYSEDTSDTQCPNNSDHKRDLTSRKNVKSRSSLALKVNDNNCRAHNGFSSHNGNVSNSTSPNRNGKVCLCELEYRDKRMRSESINVDNWDYIYKEKSFGTNLKIPEECQATPKSPQNCDHGYLSGLGAQKLDTIFRHYYPESGFGWIIVACAVFIAIVTHGLQLSAVFFLKPVLNRFKVTEVECLVR
ncbi:CLUMA_CG017922, isoform A, partial [Clunio marinus]